MLGWCIWDVPLLEKLVDPLEEADDGLYAGQPVVRRSLGEVGVSDPEGHCQSLQPRHSVLIGYVISDVDYPQPKLVQQIKRICINNFLFIKTHQILD